MASDLSSGCTDDIEIFDEKEEGEISLEDVSSSEESHPNYRHSFQALGRCPVCTAAQQCAPWCTDARAMRKTHRKRDAVHGKENRRHIKDSSGTISKHVVVSTLQEKNDDLVPISSDSDMEIVGLPGNSKQLAMCPSSKSVKVRKKKKKKRSHSTVIRGEELSSPTEVETYLVDVPVVKAVRSSKSRHGEPSSPRYSVRSPPIERLLARSPSRRYRARLLRSRSPLRRSRSPVGAAERKSPRKLRSPRRSPSARTSAKSSVPAREHPAAPSPQTFVDIELLKKVRRLESVGAGSPKNKLSKSKEHSSLKEKLSNMLKTQGEPSDEKPGSHAQGNNNSTNDNNNKKTAGAATVEIIDDDDDEDIELLRRRALETKQKRAEQKSDQAANVNSEPNPDNNTETNLNDDNDNEAYELRLIALRSAIIKNHENRVKRGVKPKRQKKSKARLESPFGKSFLDDIPIPDDEISDPGSLGTKSPNLDKVEEADGNNPEDMDLDTDVEREKEKDSMPYSPTDDLTRQIAVGAELPNSEFPDNNEVFNFSHYRNSDEGQNSLEASNYREGLDTPYSPSAPTKTPTMQRKKATDDKETPCSPYVSDYEPGIDTPYSPPSPTKTPTMEKLSKTTGGKETPCSPCGSNYEPGIDTPYSPPSPTKTLTMEKLSKTTGDKETPCSPCGSNYAPGIDTPYSPPSPTKTKVLGKSSKTRRYVKNPYALDGSDLEQGTDTPYSPSKPIEVEVEVGTPETRKISSRNDSNITETPYSPTDTPICDLDVLSPEPTETPNLSKDSENCMKKVGDEKFENASAVKNLASSMLDLSLEEENVEPMSKRPQIFSCSNRDDKSESPKFGSSVSMLSAWEDSNKTIESIRAIETLPEVDLDGSPLVTLSKEHEAMEIVIPLEISPETVEQPSIEPLYLQGLPDVTRDTNKIPTLVNRTLVPAAILKTNKNLQQRLPRKKSDNHTEPSFKSADMRPVNVAGASVKQSALFKPIKLCPISKKPPVMTTTAAAFNASFSEDSVRETKSDDESAIVETPGQIEAPATETRTKSPTPEKSQKTDEDSGRKIRKKRLRQRNRKSKSTSGSVDSPISGRDGSTMNQSNSSNSSSKQIKSTISFSRSARVSSRSPASRPSVNSRDAPSRRSKSGQMKAPSSRGERVNSTERQKEESPEPSSKNLARKSKRDRRSSRKVEAELAPESTNGRSECQTKKSIIQSSPGEGTSSALTGTTSSDPDTSRRIDRSTIETSDKNKNDENPSATKEQTEKVVETEKKRRCSLDDDEEALRALLLASLPKRQRPAEVPTTPANTTVKIPRLSDSTTSGTSTENSANKVLKESTACLSDVVFTPPNLPQLSSHSSNASTATPAEIVTATGLPKNIEVARKILASESSSVESPSPRKRVNIVAPKGPPKKVIKKVLPVITSTKVVNNAKKYQNAMLQKKLNLQRAASIYSAQNGSRNITLNNLKTNVAARPSSPKIATSSKMQQQRLIINLGSDSDSESEDESRPPSCASGDIAAGKRQPLAIPITDFEKSLDQFLKDQRKKLESVAVAKTSAATTSTSKTTPVPSAAAGKLTGLYSTPLAVRRHLPMSQQEEYRRLKHQIMERERLKLQKTIENGGLAQNRNSGSPSTPPGPLSPASPIASLQRPDNPKVSGVAIQVAPSGLITPSVAMSKDNIAGKNLQPQQKINLSKANENQPTVSVTKVSTKVTQLIPNKQLTNPTKPTALSKVDSSNPIVANNPAKTSTPKVASILSKVNSVFENVPKITASSSTPKIPPKTAQVSPNIIKTNVPLRTASLPPTKVIVGPTTGIRRNSGSHEAPSLSTNTTVESATKASSVGKTRWSLGTLSVPSGSATRRSSAPSSTRISLNPSQMLTIQIPNDRVRMDNAESTEDSRSASNSPTISGGMLRVLTTEELNNRFARIQARHVPAGRTVTLGSSAARSNNFAEAPAVPKCLPELRDKTNEPMCCDSSSIVIESNEAGRSNTECSNDTGKNVSEDTTIANSEISTLVLSRNEENSRNDTNFDSTASTFVVGQVDPESRNNFESTRTEELISDATLPTNGEVAKATKIQAKEVWEKIKSDVKSELEILTMLPIEEQKKLLTETQESLVAKRNMVLEDLTEMSGCLRQLEVEREIQTRLMGEVRRLREELKTAERRLKEQRCQMNGVGPKVTKAHEKINLGRRECYKLSRICQGLGTKIIGEDYKVPNTGAQLLNDRLKEVAVHTRQLSKKKVPAAKSPNDTVAITDSSFTEGSSDTTIGERDLDDNKVSKENSELSTPPDAIANVIAEGAEAPSPMSDGSDLVAKDNEDSSSSCQVISLTKDTEGSTNAEGISLTEETEGLKSTEVTSPTKEIEGSESAEVISLTRETEGSNSDALISLPKEAEASNSVEIISPAKENVGRKSEESRKDEAASSSDARVKNNASAKESNDYISLPGTSKCDPPTGQASSTDQPRHRAAQKVGPYRSVLTHLKIPRSDNPDGILCPYELMGTCNDGDCQFYHLDPGHCQ